MQKLPPAFQDLMQSQLHADYFLSPVRGHQDCPEHLKALQATCGVTLKILTHAADLATCSPARADEEARQLISFISEHPRAANLTFAEFSLQLMSQSAWLNGRCWVQYQVQRASAQPFQLLKRSIWPQPDRAMMIAVTFDRNPLHLAPRLEQFSYIGHFVDEMTALIDQYWSLAPSLRKRLNPVGQLRAA